MEGYPIRVNEKQDLKKAQAFLNNHAFAVGENSSRIHRSLTGG
jgi:hypothetical protein